MTVYADLLRYRELFANLFRRDFQAKYKGSLLGVLWSLLNPLVLLAVYLLVFSVIFPGKIPHYPIYLLAGLVVLDLLRHLDAVGRTVADRLRRADQEGAVPASARRLLDGRDPGGHLRGDDGRCCIVLSLIFVPEARATFWLGDPARARVRGVRRGLRAHRRLPERVSSAMSSTCWPLRCCPGSS